MTELVAKTYFTDSDTTKMVPGRGLTDTNASIGVTLYKFKPTIKYFSYL